MDPEEGNKLVSDTGGTGNKPKFGANIIPEVSFAACKAAAAERGPPVPSH